MALEVIALVSRGRHPTSGRPRRPPLDAQAVELGLGLVGPRLRLLHAGDHSASMLREFLGMGVPELRVLELPPEADIVPALVHYLGAERADILLTGQHGEGGEDSGTVPYLLGQALGMTVVANVVEISPDGNKSRVLQALPFGRRRALDVRMPFVAMVDTTAPAARQSAYGPANRGRIIKLDGIVRRDERDPGEQRPARPRPKRLTAAPSGSSAQRLEAVTGVHRAGGVVLTGLPPREAALTIYEFLQQHGVVKPGRGAPS